MVKSRFVEPDNGTLIPVLDPAHAAAIGTLTSQWSRLEYMVDRTIWELASPKTLEHGACITAQFIGIGPRLNALISLVMLSGCSAELVKEFTTFQGHAVALGNERNRIIHDPWSRSWKTKVHYRLEITAKKNLVFRHKPVALSGLNRIIAQIRDKHHEFAGLCDKFRTEQKAHPAVPGWSICSMRVPCAGDQRPAGGDMGWRGRDR
jgi:hypothetical protein